MLINRDAIVSIIIGIIVALIVCAIIDTYDAAGIVIGLIAYIAAAGTAYVAMPFQR